MEARWGRESQGPTISHLLAGTGGIVRSSTSRKKFSIPYPLVPAMQMEAAGAISSSLRVFVKESSVFQSHDDLIPFAFQ